MPEEDTPTPLDEIQELIKKDNPNVSTSENSLRRDILKMLSVTYQTAIIEENKKDAEEKFSEMITVMTGAEQLLTNASLGSLFTKDERIKVEQYVDEIDRKIFSKEARKKDEINRLLGFLGEDAE